MCAAFEWTLAAATPNGRSLAEVIPLSSKVSWETDFKKHALEIPQTGNLWILLHFLSGKFFDFGSQEMMKCPTTTDNFKRPGKIYLQVNTLLARKGCRKLQDIFFEFRHYFFPSTISALAATNKVAAPERNFTIHKVFFVPSTSGQTNTSAEINLINKPECQKITSCYFKVITTLINMLIVWSGPRWLEEKKFMGGYSK